jgi:hypothetical protein
LIVAGGSAGSSGLPEGQKATNTYNLINIRWHPGISQVRIHVETRGLVRENRHGQDLPGPRWHWRTLRLDDRLLTAPRRTVAKNASTRVRNACDQKYDDLRSDVLRETWRNFPSIEVLPSFDPTQGYEARVWIEGQQSHPDYKQPIRVEWSSNPRDFGDVYVCHRDSDPEFRARFAYYGPTLLQARMFWDDGHEAQAYIYARYPRGDRL